MLLTEEKLATYEDYELLDDGERYQLIGGELVMTPGASMYHQNIEGKLYAALLAYVTAKNLGMVFIAPLDVKLTEIDVYQPDMLFVKAGRLPRGGKPGKLTVIPDMVVEVLSTSNAYDDLTRKKNMYCESGVSEYWVVDPEEETVEILVKRGEFYQTERFIRNPGVLGSPMFPGFEMKLEELFAF